LGDTPEKTQFGLNIGCHGLIPFRYRSFFSHVSAEKAGWGKFAKAVTYHILSDVDRNMAPTIMHSNRMSNHLGEDNTVPAPGAKNLLLATRVHGLNFLK
jgi:hypothetical protein